MVEHQEINGWYEFDFIQPENNQDIWFLLDGAIIPGRYMSDLHAIVTVDGDTIPEDLIKQWHELGEKCITEFPREKEFVAVYIPELDIPALGTFTRHYTLLETGNEISAVILTDAYEFEDAGDMAIDWFKVFYWYHLPTMPRVVLTIPEVTITEVSPASVGCTECPECKENAESAEDTYEIVPAEKDQPIDDKTVAVVEPTDIPVAVNKVEDGKSAIQAYKNK